MLGNNYLFKSFIPSVEDYIIIDGFTIFLNELSYINISLPNSALICILAPLSIQSDLSIFRYKGAIELQPIDCELKGKLHLNGDIIDCKIIRIIYHTNEHKYLLHIKFNLVDLKTYQDHMENIKKKKKEFFNEEMQLGDIIDLG